MKILTKRNFVIVVFLNVTRCNIVDDTDVLDVIAAFFIMSQLLCTLL